MKTITTERLILREWNESDASDLFEFGSSQMVERAGWNLLGSTEDCKKCIQGLMNCADSWAITLKESGKVIGWILLGDINRYDRYKEIEFIVSEKSVSLLLKRKESLSFQTKIFILLKTC